jgi:hypothetical protein
MAPPSSRETLHNLLKNRPSVWSRVIAARVALSVLPLVPQDREKWVGRSQILPFRSVSTIWTVANLQLPLKAINPILGNAAPIANLAEYAIAYAVRAVKDDDRTVAAEHAALAASNAAEVFAALLPPPRLRTIEALWRNIDTDYEWLDANRTKDTKGRGLSSQGIWHNWEPKGWNASWNELAEWLLTVDQSYDVWIDWYERRIRGEKAAFDIPGDRYRKEDKKILRRLAEATDEDFWGKGHEYVNATLKGWLDEARERVQPREVHALQATDISTGPPEIGPATLEQVVRTPTQDTGAIAYGVNEQGKLDRLPNSDQAHLRDVPDQRRAYGDLREAAAELLTEGQRLGHRLQRALNRFLHSLPDGFEDAEAYLVWRDANALRRLHRAHREAAKSFEPDEARLEPVIAEGLGGLLDLYNNFAFADDGLRAKDEARIAPQERASAESEAKAAIPLVEAILNNPEIATREALDDIVADTENAELPVDDPYADQVLDQANRTRRNWIAGLLEGARTSLNNPKLLGKRAAIGVTTGVGTVVGTVATKQIFGLEYAGLIDFIVANSVVLQQYVAIAFPSFEHLPNLIDQLKLLWAKRRN